MVEKIDRFVEAALNTVPDNDQVRFFARQMSFLGTECQEKYPRFGTYIGAFTVRQAINDGLDRVGVLLREADMDGTLVGLQACGTC